MPDTMSITTLKSFTYRGNKEEYSNTYHLSGADPADEAAWEALYAAIKALERACLTSSVEWNGFLGYNAGNDHAVYSWEEPAAPGARPYGSLAIGTGIQMPGDDAVWVRWRAGMGEESHKPVYLRKYFHPAIKEAASADGVLPAQRTALAALGAGMADGSLPGGRKVCRPQGVLGTTVATSAYITTRTLKRRGKRHPSPA